MITKLVSLDSNAHTIPLDKKQNWNKNEKKNLKCQMSTFVWMIGQNAIISTQIDRQRKNTVGQRDRQTAKKREI